MSDDAIIQQPPAQPPRDPSLTRAPASGPRDITIAHGLRHLRITPEDVAAAPEITSHLRQLAATIRRIGQPRRPRALADDRPTPLAYGPGADILRSWPHYLAQMSDPQCRRVLAAYRSVPRSATAFLPIEAYCVAAKVETQHVLEQLIVLLMRLGTQASTLIAAVNQPRIVQKTVDMALTDEGIADRTLFHKATGFIPTPRSAQTNITVTQNSSANAVAQSVPAPPLEATVRRLSDRFNESRALVEPPPLELPAPAPLGVEEEDDE